APGGVRGADARESLDQRIARTDLRTAVGALGAQDDPAHEGDVLERGDAVPATGAARARGDQAERRLLRRGLPGERGAFGAPFALHDFRQAVDHDVEERADAQPEKQREPGKDGWLCEPAERRQARPPGPSSRSAGTWRSP